MNRYCMNVGYKGYEHRYPLVTHCGGAQTRNDSDLKRRVSDLDVQARAPETGGEVFLLLITEVCPLIFRSLITEVLPLISRRSDITL